MKIKLKKPATVDGILYPKGSLLSVTREEGKRLIRENLGVESDFTSVTHAHALEQAQKMGEQFEERRKQKPPQLKTDKTDK